MRQGFDRGVLAGILLLAVMMVGIAATSNVNTRNVRDIAARAAHSRKVLDTIGAIRTDARKLQASQRGYVISGIESWLAPYHEAVAALRSEVDDLKALTADDPDTEHHAAAVGRAVESGIAGLDQMIQLRREKGLDGLQAVVRERGIRSFADPLLETLAEMDGDERARLGDREAATRQAYDRAVFYGVAAAALGLTALGLFAGLVARSTRVRVRDAARLADQRELLDATLTSIGDAVIATDAAGRVTFLNPVAERLTGWPRAAAVGLPLDQVFRIANADTGAPVENPAFRALRDGVIVGLSDRTVLIARDGGERPIDDSAAPIRSRGRVGGAVLVFRDVSDRKQAEERERRAAVAAVAGAEANAKFRAFFEQGRTFAGVLALDGTVVEANRLSLDFCGFVREDVLGKPFWECGWWNRSAPLTDMVRAACGQAAAGRQFRAESTYFVADGSERYVDLILAPVTDDAGRVLFVAATGTDITERRRMEDTLREADRKKDDFIALLAHELRNPLAPIRNGLQVLRLSDTGAEAAARTREMMERQLGHMVRLIDDLLDVSRISRNKMELRRQRVLLADVVSSAVETARPVIDAEGHELTVTLPADPVPLDADLTRLAQVFSNLLANSAKYTERGGRIWLTAERQGTAVAVAVRDTGIGIPAASLENIFDMFSQVDRSLERSTGGLGIGLALVKGLSEMHGGTVAAASGGPGQGSTFTVTLPVAAETTATAPPPSENGHAAAGVRHRILVVDDSRDGAESLAMMLELLGNEVSIAYDGVEAVQRAEAFRPQVILMDVGMPNLNGLDATRQIRARPWGRDTVIVALTGWGQDGDRELSRQAGCNGHLVKPVELLQLQTLLAELRDARVG